VAGSALSVTGSIPVALSNSTGAGSVRTLVRLPGAHLYIQVPGNQNRTSAVVPSHFNSRSALSAKKARSSNLRARFLKSHYCFIKRKLCSSV